MRIKTHDESHIVELENGSEWRIWPADLERTLHWLPSTRLAVHEIDGEFCSHALLDRSNGTCVRVTDASQHWTLDMTEACTMGGRSPCPAA